MDCEQSRDQAQHHDDTSLGFDMEDEMKIRYIAAEVFEGVCQPKPSAELAHGEAGKSTKMTMEPHVRNSTAVDQGLKPVGGLDAGQGASPCPTQPGHHHPMHGHSLRSDTYLRQALASPYNQRMENLSALGFGYKAMPASSNSPSQWRQKGQQIHGSPQLEKGSGALYEGVQHWAGDGGSGMDHFSVFKTPKSSKRTIFYSPNKGRREKEVSGSPSPSSSASGSSGSGGGVPHNNPFEQGHDRLHFPVFSPDMFHAPPTPGSAEKETFQWNLEHLAELRPVHIDDKEIKRQMSRQNHDMEAEHRAQRAIDYYFQHHMVAPSPWSELPPPHVLPVTPAYGYDNGNLMAETPNQAQGSIQKDLARSRKAVDKSCQTTLTLPLGLDLEELLGDYMTYQDTDRNDSSSRESMSSSTLRRKLFFNADSSSILSPVKSGQRSPDHLSAALCTPPNFQKTTPEWERGSPIHTPSSVQFSSSPIRGLPSSEGDHRRSSFSEIGHLASPELSPIVEKKRGARTRQALVFSSKTCDTEGDEQVGFGSPIPLQMEVHDGKSFTELPSPDVSPIAALGSSGSCHLSRSHTLRGDTWQSVFSSPLHHQPHLCVSATPLPFSAVAPNTASPMRHASVTMDADGECLPRLDKEADTFSPQDSSMMEVLLGNGGHSGLDLDTLHPPSSSNLDTGYQTGSGNGSLQTTQEGGASMTTSTDGLPGHTDTNAQLKRLAVHLGSTVSDLGSTVSDHGCAVRDLGDDPRTRAVLGLTEDSCVDRMGSCVDAGATVVHSNLTTQFMSMPVGCRLPSDSVDPVVSVLTVSSAAAHLGGKPWRERAQDKRKDAVGDIGLESGGPTLTMKHVAAKQAHNLIADSETALKGQVRSHMNTDGYSRDAFHEEGSTFMGHDTYFYEHSAEFLEKMGDYLEKGGESSDEKSDKGAENIAPAVARSSSRGTEASGSVTQGARHHLTALHKNRKGTQVQSGKNTASEELASSTPTKRLLGRVAEDLTADEAQQNSPALASDVAKEIMRRAELDLRRFNQSAHTHRNNIL